MSFVSWAEEMKPNIFREYSALCVNCWISLRLYPTLHNLHCRATEDNVCKYFKRWGKGYSETNV